AVSILRGTSPIDGEPRIMGVRRAAELPLLVAVGLSQRGVLAPWWVEVRVALAAYAVTVALALAFGWSLARRRRERRLFAHHAEEVQRLEALGNMTATIAHDFRNVLAVMQSALQLIERRLKTGESVDDVIAAASDALERGMSLARRCVAFARGGELDLKAHD